MHTALFLAPPKAVAAQLLDNGKKRVIALHSGEQFGA